DQINLLWPFETGAIAQSVPFADVVINNGVYSNTPATVALDLGQPGVFVSGENPAILHGADNTPVTPESPAAKGEVVVIYCTGLGAVENPPPSGHAASETVLSPTLSIPSVTVGGVPVDVEFSGLAPNY